MGLYMAGFDDGDTVAAWADWDSAAHMTVILSNADTALHLQCSPAFACQLVEAVLACLTEQPHLPQKGR